MFLKDRILQLEKDFTKILNFLYRIDLSEESVSLEMQNTSLSFTEMLSNMIVKMRVKKGNSKELLYRLLKSVVFVIIYE